MKPFFSFVICATLLSLCCQGKQDEVKRGTLTTKPIEGFLGIKWGQSLEDAKAQLVLLSETTPSFILCDSFFCVATRLEVHLADETITAIRLESYSKGCYHALITFANGSTDQVYQHLRQTLVDKYGDPTGENSSRNFCIWDDKDSCYVALQKDDMATLSYFYQKAKENAEKERKQFDQRKAVREEDEARLRRQKELDKL